MPPSLEVGLSVTIATCALEVRQISHSYSNEVVLSGVSFSVERGSILCLLGKSGHGKSTLIRIIAGLERPAQGDIFMNGDRIDALPPYARSIGVVFQSDEALFPHLDVFGNVAFPFTQGKRTPPAGWRMQEVVDEMLTKTDIKGLARRRIHQLSGGEKQRVAVARALVYQPHLLLLDEPFNALDRPLKNDLYKLLKTLQEETSTTMLVVTHDDRDVRALASRVAVLDRPNLVAHGTLEELIDNPPAPVVRELLQID